MYIQSYFTMVRYNARDVRVCLRVDGGVEEADGVPHFTAVADELRGEAGVFDHRELQCVAGEFRVVVCVDGTTHAFEDD